MSEYFDEYQLITKIASGGMAEIFLAKHINSPITNMPFAIKRVLPRFSTNKEYVQMFLSEARIICNINHENIVRIYDFGKFHGMYYIAMEYIFGQNLGLLMKKLHDRKQKLPINVIFDIVEAVLAGLQHAHDAKDKNGVFLNIVHLDMNPNNILLGYNGKIKIVDFGIAHASYRQKKKTEEEQSTAIQGTYAYLSPEQCRSEPVDRRSDIFSVGIILWEMLTGKSLFRHYDNDAVTIQKILHEPISPPHTVDPTVSRYFSAITMRALEKDKEKRYQTAEAMLQDILKLQNTYEFDPDAPSLTDLLKQNFASHYIKMSKLLEQTQKEGIITSLFGELDELKGLSNTHGPKQQQDKEAPEKEENIEKEPFLTPIKMTVLIGAILLIALVAGHLFLRKKPTFIMVHLFSSPPGATIFINGENIGKKTPAIVPLNKGKNFIIEFRKKDENGEEYLGGTTFSPDKKHQDISLVLRRRKTVDTTENRQKEEQ